MYVIKNPHIDCDKEIYAALNDSIVKPLKNKMKIIMNKDMFLKMWNEDKKLTVNYSKSEDMNESSFRRAKKNSHTHFYI